MFKAKLLKVTTIAVFAVALVAGAGNVFAHEQEHEAKNIQAAGTAVLCPVSGEEIENKTDFTYDYEGKVYTLCCADCLASFKKNPEKYLDRDGAHAEGQTPHHEGHDHE